MGEPWSQTPKLKLVEGPTLYCSHHTSCQSKPRGPCHGQVQNPILNIRTWGREPVWGPSNILEMEPKKGVQGNSGKAGWFLSWVSSRRPFESGEQAGRKTRETQRTTSSSTCLVPCFVTVDNGVSLSFRSRVCVGKGDQPCRLLGGLDERCLWTTGHREGVQKMETSLTVTIPESREPTARGRDWHGVFSENLHQRFKNCFYPLNQPFHYSVFTWREKSRWGRLFLT